MKKLALATIAALVLGSATLPNGASAVPGGQKAGYSATHENIIQAKMTKKHKKHKHKKMMDEQKPADEKKM